jgi:hypothetical protein
MLNADVISMPDKWEYPGMRPGIWPSTISLALVDYDFAKEQLLLMLLSLCPPQRANSRLRVELQRRESAGAPGLRCSSTKRADPRPGGPAVPGAVVSGVDAEPTGGSAVRTPPGATCSPGDFSVWTTSAYSTAAPSPRAARWSRRTGRRGWRSTARTCWRSPSFSPNTTRCTKRSPSSSSAFHLDLLRDGPHRRASGRDVG